jgi:hypothetical protein
MAAAGSQYINLADCCRHSDTFDCAKRLSLAAYGRTCVDELLADGSKLVKVQGPAAPGSPVAAWMADALVPGSLRVVVSGYNAVNAKQGPVTRLRPLLSEERMRVIVLDPSWRG